MQEAARAYTVSVGTPHTAPVFSSSAMVLRPLVRWDLGHTQGRGSSLSFLELWTCQGSGNNKEVKIWDTG